MSQQSNLYSYLFTCSAVLGRTKASISFSSEDDHAELFLHTYTVCNRHPKYAMQRCQEGGYIETVTS